MHLCANAPTSCSTCDASCRCRSACQYVKRVRWRFDPQPPKIVTCSKRKDRPKALYGFDNLDFPRRASSLFDARLCLAGTRDAETGARDQVASAVLRRRYVMTPMPANPRSIIARVEASGTAPTDWTFRAMPPPLLTT